MTNLHPRYATNYDGRCSSTRNTQYSDQKSECLDVPDRYTASIGVNNKWSTELEKEQNKCSGNLCKDFDINGHISITESCHGGLTEKKFTATDGSGKNDSENVVMIGCGCDADACCYGG